MMVAVVMVVVVVGVVVMTKGRAEPLLGSPLGTCSRPDLQRRGER